MLGVVGTLALLAVVGFVVYRFIATGQFEPRLWSWITYKVIQITLLQALLHTGFSDPPPSIGDEVFLDNSAAADNLVQVLELSKAGSGIELEVFAECGHWPQHEHAARFTELARKFLG